MILVLVLHCSEVVGSTMHAFDLKTTTRSHIVCVFSIIHCTPLYLFLNWTCSVIIGKREF